MDIKLNNSKLTIAPVVAPEKKWIGHNKRLDRHTLGRVDAIAKVAIFAILTVAATVKLIGRAAILAGKTICRMDTTETKYNLKFDGVVAVMFFERIFRSAWRVVSAPKLNDLCAISSAAKALKMIMRTDHFKASLLPISDVIGIAYEGMQSAYLSSRGGSPTNEHTKPQMEFPKKRNKLVQNNFMTPPPQKKCVRA